MKKLYFLFLLISFSGFAQNVTITKVVETGCASPFVKTVELYVDGTVNFADFGPDATQNTADDVVILNYMNNGAAWSANQIDISALGTVTDSFVYIVRDIALMQAEFPSTTFTENVNTIVTATATNGDDGYQVVLNGNVVSQFGKTDTDADAEDGTADAWSHNDAVATRKTGIPDLGVWDRSHWDITAENDLDDFTNCQDSADPKTKNLEIYFATLGSTYSLGSGSGWTPTAAICTTVLTATSASCATAKVGATDDTYTASINFTGGNNGKTFAITTTSGTVGGDNPTSIETGTIEISGITEGTDITVTVKDTANGGVCDLSATVTSPACIPLIINEVLFDPASDDAGTTEIEGDANGDGTRDAAQDEFIEFFNTSDAPLDISGYKLFDGFSLGTNEPRHIFPASTIIPAKSALVVFGGGTPSGNFGNVIVQIASEGASPELNLSNSGDIITIKNTMDVIALVYNSSSTGISHSQNQSVTRSPDLTGNFILHTDANASLVFSPGLKVDGAVLSNDSFEIDGLNLFPNPIKASNSYVKIITNSNEAISVIIFDVLGKQISNQKITDNKINISTLHTGLYLIQISQGDKKSTKKLLVN